MPKKYMISNQGRYISLKIAILKLPLVKCLQIKMNDLKVNLIPHFQVRIGSFKTTLRINSIEELKCQRLQALKTRFMLTTSK